MTPADQLRTSSHRGAQRGHKRYAAESGRTPDKAARRRCQEPWQLATGSLRVNGQFVNSAVSVQNGRSSSLPPLAWQVPRAAVRVIASRCERPTRLLVEPVKRVEHV